ncbi:MAG: PEP-CTERM sorting domain-containing protein [Methanoregulaceae archaeon]|nr:PEP-CTERM sorting domain-containing protein [Methanoregulaceae archaeon]
MTHLKYVRAVSTMAFGMIATLSPAVLVANFDSLIEGAEAYTTLVDGGITFTDIYRNQGGPDYFVIEDASSGGLTGLSSPNALASGGYSPGPNYAFSAFGGMTFSAGDARSAGLDLWVFPLNLGGNTVTLSGYLGNTLVDFVSVTHPNSFSILHNRLELPDDDYDRFTVTSTGPSAMGDSFILFDNITVDAVPEPASLTALALGGLLTMRRRRR